jgi:hypothetical protein
MQTTQHLTPNDHYRRLRRIYLGAVVTALGLLVLALAATVREIGYGVPPLLLIGGVALLVVAMMVRAATRCPACTASLMWKSGPIMGTGRLSIGVKPRCPSCGLDLNKPWEPPPEAPDEETRKDP